MYQYHEKKFSIPELEGISQQTIDEHLKLYAGYVKHTNYILERIEALRKEDADGNKYEIGELRRRLGFEFDGMRNHEYYFSQFEGGPQERDSESALSARITETFGSFDEWFSEFKQMAATRGVGWALLYYDDVEDHLINAWIDEQQLGHLIGLKPILALDMWEHSFMLDFPPSEKAKYIDAFFSNLNWRVVEDRFQA